MCFERDSLFVKVVSALAKKLNNFSKQTTAILNLALTAIFFSPVLSESVHASFWCLNKTKAISLKRGKFMCIVEEPKRCKLDSIRGVLQGSKND